MSGRIGLLSALLALQLVIIAAVLFAQSGAGEREAGPFLEFEPEAVDEIQITGGGDEAAAEVTLVRTEQGWRLPSGLPADADKAGSVLARLADLRAPFPVTTSGSGAERFEVAADNFQRRVVLRSDGEVAADFYLGTSPGYQQVHARRAAEEAVYSVPLSNYQLPAEADQWLDGTLLQPSGEIVAVEREGAWRLSRSEDGWALDDAPADQQAADELAQRLAELRVSGVAEAPADDARPAGVLAITDDQGSQRLTLFASGENEPYRIASDRQEGWFSLASYLADGLLLEAEALRPAGEQAPDEDAGQAADAAPGEAPEPDSEG